MSLTNSISAPSRSQRLMLGFAISVAVVVLGSCVFLLVGGARVGAPFVFIMFAGVALCVTLLTLARSALSLVFEPQADEVRVATGRRKKELEREKQALLKALKELAFDHEMRKISDGDYHEIESAYRARAVRVMRQLDEASLDHRELMEREIAARRAARTMPHEAGSAASTVVAAGGEAADAEPASPGVATDESQALVQAAGGGRVGCAGCGAKNEIDAAFCKACGMRMTAVGSAS